jgi:histidyl-tRNA synthetase
MKVLINLTENLTRYGAQPMQTPVFEIKQLLMDKYGADSDKQVYELNEDNVLNQISGVLKNQDDDESTRLTKIQKCIQGEFVVDYNITFTSHKVT